jgi:hypothetical protein
LKNIHLAKLEWSGCSFGDSAPDLRCKRGRCGCDGEYTPAMEAIVFQETIDASGANVGYSVAKGSSYAGYAAAIKSDIAAGVASGLNAEMVKQMTIDNARDSVGGTGLTNRLMRLTPGLSH